MSVIHIDVVAGTTKRLEVFFGDTAGDPVTGLTPTVLIKRDSDSKFLKADGTWQVAVPTGGDVINATELDATNYPGRYHYDFTPPAEAFDVEYDVLFDGTASADNRYQDAVVRSVLPPGAVEFEHKIGGANPDRRKVLHTDGTTLATLDPSQPDEETQKMTLTP